MTSPYQMAIQNIASYIREQNYGLAFADGLDAFEAARVLAIAFAKEQREVLKDIAQDSILGGPATKYTIYIPWEPDPKKRTEWHPTVPKGTFSTIQRGLFSSHEEAHAWAKAKLGIEATYTVVPCGAKDP